MACGTPRQRRLGSSAQPSNASGGMARRRGPEKAPRRARRRAPVPRIPRQFLVRPFSFDRTTAGTCSNARSFPMMQSDPPGQEERGLSSSHEASPFISDLFALARDIAANSFSPNPVDMPVKFRLQLLYIASTPYQTISARPRPAETDASVLTLSSTRRQHVDCGQDQ